MAGKTEYIYLQGKIKYYDLERPNEWGNFTARLYPNEESYKQILALKERGLKNQLKKDDDGYYMTFNRPTQKFVKGRTVTFSPPQILQPDGTPFLHNILIGYGSDVTIGLAVYGFGGNFSGIAARLENVRIDNLVPFELKRDMPEPYVKKAEYLLEQPAQQ